MSFDGGGPGGSLVTRSAPGVGAVCAPAASVTPNRIGGPPLRDRRCGRRREQNVTQLCWLGGVCVFWPAQRAPTGKPPSHRWRSGLPTGGRPQEVISLTDLPVKQ